MGAACAHGFSDFATKRSRSRHWSPAAIEQAAQTKNQHSSSYTIASPAAQACRRFANPGADARRNVGSQAGARARRAGFHYRLARAFARFRAQSSRSHAVSGSSAGRSTGAADNRQATPVRWPGRPRGAAGRNPGEIHRLACQRPTCIPNCRDQASTSAPWRGGGHLSRTSQAALNV